MISLWLHGKIVNWSAVVLRSVSCFRLFNKVCSSHLTYSQKSMIFVCKRHIKYNKHTNNSNNNGCNGHGNNNDNNYDHTEKLLRILSHQLQLSRAHLHTDPLNYFHLWVVACVCTLTFLLLLSLLWHPTFWSFSASECCCCC